MNYLTFFEGKTLFNEIVALVGFEGQIKLEVDNVAFEFTSLSEKNLILIQINWLSSEEFGFF